MIITKKILFCGGNFNLTFDCKFHVSGGKKSLAKKSLAKLTEIKETLYLCDIWRIRNPNVRRFTFLQNYVFGFIERKPDFFLISNILQWSIIKPDIFRCFCIDHLSIFFFLYNFLSTWGKTFRNLKIL